MQMHLTLCLENRPWEPHQKQFLKNQGFHMPIANHPPISPIPEMDRNGWYKISPKGRFIAGKNHVVTPPSGIPNRTGPPLAATGCRWDWPTEQSQNGLDPLRPPSMTGNDLPPNHSWNTETVWEPMEGKKCLEGSWLCTHHHSLGNLCPSAQTGSESNGKWVYHPLITHREHDHMLQQTSPNQFNLISRLYLSGFYGRCIVG